ncbi:hypothetical protein F5X99DRAFT_367515 [Biscogniauxia marginata]|nr:hypothetical protein F5X99DRAFT_367515 [Biscogniauxia marginata]
MQSRTPTTIYMHGDVVQAATFDSPIGFPYPVQPQPDASIGGGNDEAGRQAVDAANWASDVGTLESRSLPNQLSCSVSYCDLEFDSEDALYRHNRSPHAPGHYIVDHSIFKCKCGVQFTKLYTIERHIKGFQESTPEYACHECNAYTGKAAFTRKDNLVQHLRVFRKYEPAQLETLFPPRQARMYAISVCHFRSCEHYRGAEFNDLGYQEQQRNRPFAKQSDYTAHMKKDYGWSPHPCDFPGCKKVDGKGFFSFTALVKHRDEQHPGAVPLELKPRVVRKIKCGKCHERMSPAAMTYHLLHCS